MILAVVALAVGLPPSAFAVVGWTSSKPHTLNPSMCLEAAHPRKVTANSPIPVFVHVQKTGGTTFSMALLVSYAANEILSTSCLSQSINITEARNLKTAKIGFGHLTRREVANSELSSDSHRGISPITMIRDVVGHRKSLYLEKVDHAKYRRPIDWVRSSTYPSNFQLEHTLLNAANATLEGAKRELCSLEYIGVSEQMEDSLCLFGYKFKRRTELFTSYRVKPDKRRDEGWDAQAINVTRKESTLENRVMTFAKEMFQARVEITNTCGLAWLISAAKLDIKKSLTAKGGGELKQHSKWICTKWAIELGLEQNPFVPDKALVKEKFFCGYGHAHLDEH
eukprot:jgi/Bigna1/89669/estExt_fgenesh1_pg.C_530070